MAQAAALSVQSENFAEVVSRFKLTSQDLELIYNHVKRLGLESPEALSAITNLDVVEFYFDKIGRDGHCNVFKSLELLTLARTPP